MTDLDTKIDRRALLAGGGPRETVVRPPGAVEPRRFAALCDGCGACAEVCPVGAIRMTAQAATTGHATPQVVADDAPCAMCDGFVCSTACPTQALVPVVAETMRIARIRFDGDACWARQGLDPSCDYCFDRCPLKGVAITYRRGQGPKINETACTGCGTCAYFCPAQPKALAAVPL